jgi:hypothetical protein
MTTLDHEVAPAEAPSVTRLVSGIIDDATSLIGQQASMLRAEIREDLRRTGQAAKYLGFGSALVGMGGLFLALGLVPLLNVLVPSLPVWACWGIVGGTLLVLGGIALAIGRTILKSFTALPNKTLAALQENVTWITKPRS